MKDKQFKAPSSFSMTEYVIVLFSVTIKHYSSPADAWRFQQSTACNPTAVSGQNILSIQHGTAFTIMGSATNVRRFWQNQKARGTKKHQIRSDFPSDTLRVPEVWETELNQKEKSL